MQETAAFSCELSIVIPLRDERQSLKPLYEWTAGVMRAHGLSYEIVFVDDGSTDGSWQEIEAIMMADRARVRGIRFYKNHGKAIALREAFKLVTGRVVATMDADMQDSPDELPALHKMIAETDYDLVSGWRVQRKDAWNRRFFSRIFNRVVSFAFKIPLHDSNCGLKGLSQFRG